MTLTPINIVQAAADLVWSPVLRKFPIKIALSEGGIGWIPYFLERVDHGYKTHRAWTGQDFGGRLPSEVFNDHIVTCFITDDFGVESRTRLDLNNVTWECDYPHSDTTWPNSPEVFWKTVDDMGVSDEDINRISHLNAIHHYSFDPFSAAPREQCTVRALRSEAAGHDTSLHATGSTSKLDHNMLAAEFAVPNR
jgi:hypothetical protein